MASTEGSTSASISGSTNDINNTEGQPHIDKKLIGLANKIWLQLINKTQYIKYKDAVDLSYSVKLDPVEYKLLEDAATWHNFTDKLMEGTTVEWVSQNKEWSINTTYVPNHVVHNVFPKDHYDKIQATIDPIKLKNIFMTKFIDELQKCQEKTMMRTRLYNIVAMDWDELYEIVDKKLDYGLDKLREFKVDDGMLYAIWDNNEILCRKNQSTALIKTLFAQSLNKNDCTYIYNDDRYDKEIIDEIINEIIRNKKTLGLGNLKSLKILNNQIVVKWYQDSQCAIQ
jgi:hypothetical protein